MQTLLRFQIVVIILVIGFKGVSQPIITTDTVIQTSLCAGSNIIIPFTVIDTAGSFNFGNIFTAQLSDNFGFFSNPVDIGVFPFPWTTSGFIFGTIPINSPLFGIYKVRVVGSIPVVVGSESANYVVILNTAVLAIITSPDSIICEGDSTALTATPIFSSYQWEQNGNSIVGATSQTFTASQNGSYSVTVIDTIGCETTSEPFNVFVENCVGISNYKMNNQEFTIYPNPVSTYISISCEDLSFSGAIVFIYNIMGQVLLMQEIQNKTSDLKVNTKDFPPGIYTVKINSSFSSWRSKFIKL